MKKLAMLLTLAMTVTLMAEHSQQNEYQLAGEIHRAETSKNDDHIPVGSRALSHSEHVAVQESRAERAKEAEAPAEACGEEIVIQQKTEEADAVAASSLKPRAVYHTSHSGVYHRPIAVSADGRGVTLHDGSYWTVASYDAYKTLDWLASDNILILPNHSWFSAYHYVLVNQQTGRSCDANITLGPLYNGVYTHWVVAIDYLAREVILEDGSFWKISAGDYTNLNKWVVNDTVMIGINDTWFSSYPNILINVNLLNYIEADCLN